MGNRTHATLEQQHKWKHWRLDAVLASASTAALTRLEVQTMGAHASILARTFIPPLPRARRWHLPSARSLPLALLWRTLRHTISSRRARRSRASRSTKVSSRPRPTTLRTPSRCYCQGRDLYRWCHERQRERRQLRRLQAPPRGVALCVSSDSTVQAYRCAPRLRISSSTPAACRSQPLNVKRHQGRIADDVCETLGAFSGDLRILRNGSTDLPHLAPCRIGHALREISLIRIWDGVSGWTHDDRSVLTSHAGRSASASRRYVDIRLR